MVRQLRITLTRSVPVPIQGEWLRSRSRRERMNTQFFAPVMHGRNHGEIQIPRPYNTESVMDGGEEVPVVIRPVNERFPITPQSPPPNSNPPQTPDAPVPRRPPIRRLRPPPLPRRIHPDIYRDINGEIDPEYFEYLMDFFHRQDQQQQQDRNHNLHELGLALCVDCLMTVHVDSSRCDECFLQYRNSRTIDLTEPIIIDLTE